MHLSFNVLLLGDVYFGETYARGTITEQVGYRHSLSHVHAFVEHADYTIANFEGPILDNLETHSPINSKRKYIHAADLKYTGPILRWLGVDAVSLANNHTMDYRVSGIKSTFDALDDAGIKWFGAGNSLVEARAHHVVPLPNKFGTGDLRFAGMYQHLDGMAADGVYASNSTPGLASLNRSEPRELEVKASENDFAVAFPHWGKNYRPITRDQTLMAQALDAAGYRAVIGHGSHSLQQATLVGTTPTFFGIGNGIFNSPGRYSKVADPKACPPYSVWAMLTVSTSRQRRDVSLKLYPVYSDNSITGYCPAPVTEKDFNEVTAFLSQTANIAHPLSLTPRKDDLGFHLVTNIGEWTIQEPPLHQADESTNIEIIQPGKASVEYRPPEMTVEDLPPQNVYSDSLSLSLLEQVHKHGRMNGTVILADAATRDGAEVQWIGTSLAVAELHGERTLLSSHRGTESPVGATIVKDKLLAKQFLQNAGVATPRGKRVRSADEARAFMDEIGKPIVIKPRFGSTGKGVSLGLTDASLISKAFKVAADYGDVIVEETINIANEYRCLASTSKCYSVTQRLLPSVVGNGASTIETLILRKNEERQGSLSTLNRPTPIDYITERTLEKQGYSLSSVLEPGKRLTVRDVGGLSSGGEPAEKTATVKPSVKKIAVAATAAVPGLNWAGSDVIISTDGQPYIIEINTSADISGATYPLYGKPVPVGDILWNHLKFRPAKPAPIELVKGPSAQRDVPSKDWHPLGHAARLSSLFSKALETHGIAFEKFDKSIRRVTVAGKELWFRNVSSITDRGSSITLVSRHRQMRDFLEFHGFPVSSAHYRLNRIRLQELRPSLEGNWAVVHGRRPWPGRDQNIGVPGSSLTTDDLKGKAPNVLQHVPDGDLFRVLTSPHGSLLVLSPKTQSADNVELAHELAMSVINSIPDLSFVAIDLLLSKTPLKTGAFQVEGLTVNPVIRPEWAVVSGSLERVWEHLLGLQFE